MQFRRLGRTELMAAEVGLDTRAFARLGAERATSIVTAALDSGMNILELAAGDAAAADAIRPAIERRRAHALIVLTGDGDAGALGETLARLDIECCDCYLIDAVDSADAGGAAVAKLEALRGGGLAGAVGVAAAGAEAALVAIAGGHADVVQLPHHVMLGGATEPVFEAAAAADVGVLGCSPLAEGTLADPAGAGAGLASLTEGAPRTVAQGAIAWSLSDHRLSATVAGASSPEHAAENAEASRVAPLPPGDLERVAQLFRDVTVD